MTISSRPKVRKNINKNPSILESLGVSITGGLNSEVRVNVSGLRDVRVGSVKKEKFESPSDIHNRVMSDLCRSARQGNLFDVNLILDTTPDLLNSVSNASEDCFGSNGSPLHYATIGNQPDIVHALLVRGANITLQTSRGMTALHLSCTRGFVECASLLLDHGASMMNKDKFGITPLNIVNQGFKELKLARTAIYTYYNKYRGGFKNNMTYKIDKIGSSIFLKQNNKYISPWHSLKWDINDKVFPYVCEIPAGTSCKMEVDLKNKHNPIVQDKYANGNLRHWSMAPKFSYGMISQTFENPDKKCPIADKYGDADPIDVVDISANGRVGDVLPAKLLGSFCLIDQGEADWKIIVSTNDNDSLNKEILQDMFHFFETYKPNSKNYIHNNRQLFTEIETRDILQLASINYKELAERSKNDEKCDFWFPHTE